MIAVISTPTRHTHTFSFPFLSIWTVQIHNTVLSSKKVHTKRGTMTVRPFVNNLGFFFGNAILLFVRRRYFSKTANLSCCCPLPPCWGRYTAPRAQTPSRHGGKPGSVQSSPQGLEVQVGALPAPPKRTVQLCTTPSRQHLKAECNTTTTGIFK